MTGCDGFSDLAAPIGLERRHVLKTLGAATAGCLLGSAPALASPQVLRGVIPVGNTPYDESGAVEWDDLARQAVLYERCGAQGIIWPAGGSDVDMLTREERLRGMAVVRDACRPLSLACILAVHASTTAEMLDYARHAESLQPDAIYVASPAGEASEDELYRHFAALAGATGRALVIFASVGMSTPLDLVVRLARDLPNPIYLRTDGQPAAAHISAAVAAKPVLQSVFGASAGSRWLYEQRLGADGIMTHLGMYADVMERMWRALVEGNRELATEIYSKLLLMINCDTPLLAYKEAIIPGTGRYVLHRRGWFRTTTMRRREPLGTPPSVVTINLTPHEAAEVDSRLAALRPYMAV